MKGKILAMAIMAGAAAPAHAGWTCYWVTPSTSTVAPDGTVTTSYGTPFQKCVYLDTSAPGDGGGGGIGGGGGTASGDGVWVTVPGQDYVAEVNVVKNQVRTDDISCGDLQVQRQVVAGRILVKNPYLKASTVVTVFFSDGEQKFQRLNGTTGNFQMLPTSACVIKG